MPHINKAKAVIIEGLLKSLVKAEVLFMHTNLYNVANIYKFGSMKQHIRICACPNIMSVNQMIICKNGVYLVQTLELLG